MWAEGGGRGAVKLHHKTQVNFKALALCVSYFFLIHFISLILIFRLARRWRHATSLLPLNPLVVTKRQRGGLKTRLEFTFERKVAPPRDRRSKFTYSDFSFIKTFIQFWGGGKSEN